LGVKEEKPAGVMFSAKDGFPAALNTEAAI